jgi:hypothetical protein
MNAFAIAAYARSSRAVTMETCMAASDVTRAAPSEHAHILGLVSVTVAADVAAHVIAAAPHSA